MPQWAVPIIIMCVNLNQSAKRMLWLKQVNASGQLLSECQAYPVAIMSITSDSEARGLPCGKNVMSSFSQAVIPPNQMKPQFIPHAMAYGACDDEVASFGVYRLPRPLGPQWPDQRKRASRPLGSVHLVTKPLNGTAIQTAIPLGG